MQTFAGCGLKRSLSAVIALLGMVAARTLADDNVPKINAVKDEPKDVVAEEKGDVAERRMAVMKSRAESFRFTSSDKDFPKQLQPMPLFRYEDQTRGYVDGTVWRLGEQGRPLAIITAELHPMYLSAGSVIVYDFLSLTERPFTAKSADVTGWTPGGSAVTMERIPDAPEPAKAAAARLGQIKQLARRFKATQEVRELDTSFVHLRMLPREIDRYSPDKTAESDGAIFLFVNGRNPAIVLLIETKGQEWIYGVGRLSAPSELTMRLDDTVVWKQPRAFESLSWTNPYTASNAPATFP
ncbi:MAG: hypothetical protein AABP62_31515 [Planctomycetota bacterium]